MSSRHGERVEPVRQAPGGVEQRRIAAIASRVGRLLNSASGISAPTTNRVRGSRRTGEDWRRDPELRGARCCDVLALAVDLEQVGVAAGEPNTKRSPSTSMT